MKSGQAKTYLPDHLLQYKGNKAGLSEHWAMVYQKDNPPKGALHTINVPTINVPTINVPMINVPMINAPNVSVVHTSVFQDIEFIRV